MKIVRKVKSIEVKRAYVTAQIIRYSRKKQERYLPKLNRKEYLKKLVQAKRKSSQFTEKQLDKFIAKEWKSRESAYNNTDWHLAIVSLHEVGVWRCAGGLPAAWTCCSLAQSMQHVKRGLEINSKHIRLRSKRAIPRIIEHSDIISRDKDLYPIVFKGGTGTKGRKLCQVKVKGDIDDGDMRAIALAICGYKKLNIYFGIPRNKVKVKNKLDPHTQIPF